MSEKSVSDLQAQAASLSITLSAEQLAKITQFIEILYRENETTNLTRVPREQAFTRHILDSLALIRLVPAGLSKIIDVGTGAGLPGIPLAIVRNDWSLTLVDSSQKRVKFLELVVEQLALTNVVCVHGRGELLGRTPEFREIFDVAVARALAPLEILAEILVPFVRVGGAVIAIKGAEAGAELESAKSILAELGIEDFQIREGMRNSSVLPGAYFICSKTQSVPERFPRVSLGKRWERLKHES